MHETVRRIVEATQEDLRDEWIDWRAVTRAARSRSDQKPRHSFLAAIRRPQVRGPRIIGNIGAPALATAGMREIDAATSASAWKQRGAAALSVVTEGHYLGGRREWLYRAGAASGLPVLMLDCILEPVQVFRGIASGADAVLLLPALLEQPRLRELVAVLDELGRDAVIAVHDEAELSRAVESGARIIGLSDRSLETLDLDPELPQRLVPLIPPDLVRLLRAGATPEGAIKESDYPGIDAVLLEAPSGVF
jgi:indole-3-glycerol phosphate synthase